MPNHVTNRLTIIGEETEVAKVLLEIKGSQDDQFIDFNTFAPMPNELRSVTSPTRIISQEDYDKQEERIAKNELTDLEKNFGVSRGITKEISAEYQDKFGVDNWYDWSIENWGTKWNAYDQSICDNEIVFCTAWSTSQMAIQLLSIKYPNAKFCIQYADEDFGYNVGEYHVENGVITYIYIPNGGSKEALRMAMDINGDQEYYLENYLCDELDEELSEFAESLVEMAHEEQYLVAEYPVVVLNKLKELALADERYERIIEIDRLLKNKEIAE